MMNLHLQPLLLSTVIMSWQRTSFSEKWPQATASFPDDCWPKPAALLAGWNATFQSTWPAQRTSLRTPLWTHRKGPWPRWRGTSATLGSWYRSCFCCRNVCVVILFEFPSFHQSVEERCFYKVDPENGSWTEITREAWISSNVFGLSRAIQVSRVERRLRCLTERRLSHFSSVKVSSVLVHFVDIPGIWAGKI